MMREERLLGLPFDCDWLENGTSFSFPEEELDRLELAPELG